MRKFAAKLGEGGVQSHNERFMANGSRSKLAVWVTYPGVGLAFQRPARCNLAAVLRAMVLSLVSKGGR